MTKFHIETSKVRVERIAPRASTFDVFLADGILYGRFNRDDVQGVIDLIEGRDTEAARRVS